MAGGRAVSNAAKSNTPKVLIRPRCCNYCGQTLPETRMGVRLTPLKARILDVVTRAGPDGISARDLFGIVFESGERSRETLKAHVWQINDAIADEAGYRIAGTDGFYRLTKC
jgi:hypothetical protein